MDLYGTNNAAISMGNSRRQEVRDMNERIKQHNVDIVNQISGLKDQVKTTASIQQAQDTAKALWTGSKMPDKIKAYKDYKLAQAAKTAGGAESGEGLISGLKTSAKGAVSDIMSGARDAAGQAVSQATGAVSEAINGAKVTATGAVSGATRSLGDATGAVSGVTRSLGDAVEEGGLARSATQAGESAAGDIAESLSNAGAKGVGSAIATAAKSGGGEVAESLGSKVAGGLGKAAGGAFGGAMAGLDIYEDIKSKGIAGNNNWEKAGNLLQIGGGIADLAGMAFPPLALLGGVLDLASGATEAVGEKLDADKTASDLSKQQQQETEKPDTEVVQQATLTTGRVD